MNDELLIQTAELFNVDVLILKFILSNVDFLKKIGATKSQIIQSVLIQCRSDQESYAMMYLLGRSEQVIPKFILN